MQVNVKLIGPLRDYLPRGQKGKGQLTLQENATVADALAMLAINRPVAAAINAAHESAYDAPLADGDTLTLFEQSAGG